MEDLDNMLARIRAATVANGPQWLRDQLSGLLPESGQPRERLLSWVKELGGILITGVPRGQEVGQPQDPTPLLQLYRTIQLLLRVLRPPLEQPCGGRVRSPSAGLMPGMDGTVNRRSGGYQKGTGAETTAQRDLRTASVTSPRQRAQRGRRNSRENGAAASSDVIGQRLSAERSTGGIHEEAERSEGELSASEEGEEGADAGPWRREDDQLQGSGVTAERSGQP
ncbi:hypothetical protein AB205_0109150, partial [Aquarana catesbeiana]